MKKVGGDKITNNNDWGNAKYGLSLQIGIKRY